MTNKEKMYLFYIFVLVMIGSGFELLAVAIFSPYIELITGSSGNDAGTLSTISKTIIGYIFGTDKTNEYIIGLSILIIVIYIAKNLFLSYEKNTVYQYSYGMQHRVAKKLLSSYMMMPYTFHLGTNPAELVRSIISDVDRFTKVIIHTMELVMEIVVCVVLGVYLFFVSPIITGVIAVLLAIALLLYFKFAKGRLKKLGKENQQFEASVYKNINQALGGIKEIKILERDDYFLDEFSTSLYGNLRIQRISRLMASLPKYFIEAICISGLMIAVIIMMLLDNGNASRFVPQIAVFATAAFRLMPSVGRINEHMAAIDGGDASISLIYNDLRSIDECGTTRAITQKDTKLNFNNIVLTNIDYRYPDSEKNVFSNVNLSIKKGETVAFIGESGAGKTTLVDIILGILPPVKGHVFADDVDIFDDNLSGWHKNIGYIPQFIYLSDDTIRNNIAFGIMPKEIDDKKVVAAAKKAKLFDFVDSLPDGFDTVVGERGARLSGGQRQRIGIARALYHDPEIIVMDEATSALDNETETAVMESIDGLHGMKTMVIIAHRLSTIKNADEIYEVSKGEVVKRRKEDVIKN